MYKQYIILYSMNNITLITSIISTPSLPFNYTNVRSVFTKNERFEQLKKTIASIRKMIPSSKIMMVECSNLDEPDKAYITDNVDYFLNIYDPQNITLINDIYSHSKALGEGTMTIHALEYLNNNKIEFDNIFKISGRYWLNEHFDISVFRGSNNVIHKINGDSNNMFTCFYKLNKKTANKWLEYLKVNKYTELNGHIGFENVFANFINRGGIDCVFIDNVGISGYVSVCGTYIDM